LEGEQDGLELHSIWSDCLGVCVRGLPLVHDGVVVPFSVVGSEVFPSVFAGEIGLCPTSVPGNGAEYCRGPKGLLISRSVDDCAKGWRGSDPVSSIAEDLESCLIPSLEKRMSVSCILLCGRWLGGEEVSVNV
jgi:hypothetical protein